jgi:hypothetical protein
LVAGFIDGGAVMRWKWRLLSVVGVAAGAAGLIARARVQPVAVSFREELLQGARFADSLEGVLAERSTENVATSEAMASLYLERHRLGLGSPFRLIDQALHDPMVTADVRRPLGFAMLARTLDGAGYQTDPRALDLISRQYEWLRARGGSADTQKTGNEHLSLIRAEVGRARDARVGELTVRLAYRLAVAGGTLPPRAIELGTIAAAQERDRILAMHDARNLIDAAARANVDPLALLRLWREGRALAVERPVIDPLSAESQRSAVAALPEFVERLEAVAAIDEGARPATHESLGVLRAGARPGEALARRVAGVAQARNSPPEAPIGVSVTGYSSLVQRAGTAPLERAIRQRFVAMARSEETVAAEYALLRSRLPGGASEAAATVLTVAVALRPYAQDRGWLPGDAAPTPHDLSTRYGVKVTFDRDVPVDWQGYLQRQLAQAIDDFWRVFPGYDTRGLKVRFGDSPLHEKALALHDPVTRTIYFPVGSSAGVMAHEFAHDLDWLAARRYYGGAVGYRTDRAVKQVSDQLASALRQMAGALRPDTTRGHNDPQTRPTEIFARNVDWFVSAALANEGRMNGHLSAVQDQVLTGYGSAMSPEASRDGGSATLRALDGITLVPPHVRAWFTQRYGASWHISATEAVRRVLETPISAVEVRSPSRYALSSAEATAALMKSDPSASRAWSCLINAEDEVDGDTHLTRTVMQYAAEARARGAVQRWRAFASRFSPRGLSPLRALEGPPWDPALADAMVRDVRDAILWRAVGGTAAASPARSPFAPGGVGGSGCSR